MITDEGADLLAQCVEANVRAAAHTTNALLEGERAIQRDLAAALVDLYDSVADVPDSIRTVAQEKALWRVAPAYDQALRLLREDPS